MSSERIIKYGVSVGSLRGSSIARNREFTMMTLIDIDSNS